MRFVKLMGIALTALSVGYAVVLAAEQVNTTEEATLPDSLQYVLESAGWGDALWIDVAQIREQLGGQISGRADAQTLKSTAVERVTLPSDVSTYFGVVAGGGAPSYNEIALEKNVLYFQRSLTERGLISTFANIFFANGDNGQETVRYLDETGEQQFKAPDIGGLTGAANYGNTKGWFEAVAKAKKPCPAFFYFTGHGAHNLENEDNNWLILWEEALVSVKEMAGWLDPLPADQPFVTMMAQCYSGSFANLIYENGDPEQPVALQTRCGFFATVASRPSVGCTPAVNEADYKDYSSSFFAGLTGRDRVGNLVSSADYNLDSKISYAEAHAFAKVDEETTDWPISTVEAWLQRQLSSGEESAILAQPMSSWWAIARPEQQYVVESLTVKTGFDPYLSYAENVRRLGVSKTNTVKEAYQMRLKMELLNVGAEAIIRDNGESEAIATLEKIVNCEAGTW